MPDLSPEQRAQQNNRHKDGTYAHKILGEADLDLPDTPRPAESLSLLDRISLPEPPGPLARGR